jgi:hypothetical protein
VDFWFNPRRRKVYMKTLQKDLRDVNKALKALSKKTEKIMKAVDKLGKTKAAPKKKAVKAQPKPKARIKKARVKPAAKMKAPARKVAKKKPPAKKAKTMTATDRILSIIRRAKKGIDAPRIMKKTGFEDKKVRNILMRASKQGKIKRASRGIYVAP